MRVIGIAGGSGSGKSTVAVALCRDHPERFALVHLDDYFKKKDQVPTLHGFTNWEDPEALRFDDLYHDLLALKEGKSIQVRTKSELYHPTYDAAVGGKIDYVIDPKPIVVVEGYMAFYDERIRGCMDLKIYLDIDIVESSRRRSANKGAIGDEYFEKVLKPGHARYVEPTKRHADKVVDVSDKDAATVYALVDDLISGSRYYHQ